MIKVGFARSFRPHFWGIDAIRGIHQNVAFWAHVGGFLSGLATCKYLKYEGHARREKLEHVVDKTINQRVGYGEGIRAGEQLLKTDTENPQLYLKMAQAKSRWGTSKEGKEYYEKAIKLLLETDRDKAVEVFVEYWKKYLSVMEPRYQLRMSRLLNTCGYTRLAQTTLEALINSDHPLDISMEGAYLNLARFYEQESRRYDLARVVYKKYLQKFPETEHRAFVEKRLRSMQEGAGP